MRHVLVRKLDPPSRKWNKESNDDFEKHRFRFALGPCDTSTAPPPPPPHTLKKQNLTIESGLEVMERQSRRSHTRRRISFSAALILLLCAPAAFAQPGKPEMIPFISGTGNFGAYFLVKWTHPANGAPNYYEIRTADEQLTQTGYSGSTTEARFMRSPTTLRRGYNYTLKVRGHTVSGGGVFGPWSHTTTARAALPTVTAGNVKMTSATLTVDNLPAQWWYKGEQAGATCTAVPNGTSAVTLTGLNPGVSYTYNVYYRDTCTEDSDKAAHWDVETTFTTATATLAASNVKETKATLTLSGHTAAWWYQGNQTNAACTSVAASTATANLTGLTGGTNYTYKAYSDSGCATEITTASTDAEFSTVGLTAGSVTASGATLTLANWTNAWWYKGDQSGALCESVATNTATANLSSLDALTNHIYTVYSAANCNAADKIADVAFTTLSDASLDVSAITETTATLTLGGTWPGNWYHKQVDPTGGTCSSAQTGTTANLTNLTGGVQYSWQAYSDSNCMTDLAATFFSTVGLTANPTSTGATLTLAFWPSAWWHNKTTGPGAASCTSVAANTRTAALSGLTTASDYTWTVYSAANCNAADKIADVDFSTSTVSLAASGVKETTATLTIGNHTAAWWYQGDQDGAACTAVAASTATASLSGLTGGAEYTYKAYSATGCNATNLLATAAAFSTVGLTATSVTQTGATLTLSNWTTAWWHKKTAPATPAGTCASVAANTTTADLADLTPNSDYTWTVYSASGCADTNEVADVDFSTPALPLAAPTLSAPDASANARRISLSWSHPASVSGLGAYRIRYREKGQDTWTYADANSNSGEQNFAGSATSATIPAHESFTMKDNTIYEVEVRAGKWNGGYGGWGTWTDTAEALTLPGQPAKPEATSGAGSGTLTLAASVAGNGALSKWQYVKKEGAGNFETTWTDISVTSTSLNHVVDGLTDGTSYQFKVRAVNATGTGADSDASDAATPADETLTASAVTQTTATLTIGNHTGSWYYKYTSPTGGTCSSEQTGTTAGLTTLTGGTAYTFAAYSDSNCTNTVATAAAFTTKDLAGSAITATTATLTISSHTGDWYYKHTSPMGGTCSSAQTGPTASLTDLSTNTSYTYKAYSDSGCSTLLATAAAFTTRLGPPANVALEARNARIGVSWDAKTGATGYKVQWKSGNEEYGSARQNTISGGSSTSSDISSLTNDTTYTVRVAATNANGDGDWSTELTATPRAATLTASDVTQTTATLTIGNHTAAWWYQGDQDGAACTAVAASTATASLSSLMGGTEYAYKAYSDSGCTTELTTDATDAEFSTVGLTASDLAQTTATLNLANWTADWWHNKTSGTGSHTCTKVNQGTHTANLADLTPNSDYTWAVYGVADCDANDKVADVAFTTSATLSLAAPTLSAPDASANARRISLSWSHPAGVSGLGAYRIRYREKGQDTWTYADANSNSGEQNFAGSATSATIPAHESFTMKDNTIYEVEVRAGKWNGGYGGWGTWTDTAEALTLPGQPAKPEATSGAGSGTLTLAASVAGNGALSKWQYVKKEGAGNFETTWTDISVTSTSLNHDVSGLTNGTSYQFKVRAVNVTGTGADSDASDAATPADETLTASAVEATTATLTIGHHTGDWHYKANAAPHASCSSAVTGTAARLTGLSTNTNYTYKAYSDNGCNTELATETLLTKPRKPSKPTATTGPGSGELTLAASVGGDGTLSKWQYAKKEGNGDFETATWTDISVTSTSLNHVVTGLTGGTSYQFKVRAVNATGTGADSDASDAATPTTAPGAPSKPDAAVPDSKPDTQRVVLSWTLGSDGGAAVTRWQYAYKTTGDYGSWTDIPNSGPNTTSHTVTGLTAGVAHQFKLRAWNSVGAGAESPESDAVTPLAAGVGGIGGGGGDSSDPELNVTAVTATAAQLTIEGHSGEWWYKLSGGACVGPNANDATMELAGLTAGTDYTAVAYGASDCETELGTAAFATPGLVLSLHSTELLEGTTTSFTVKLFTRPAGPVTVALSLTGDTAGLTLDTGAGGADGSAELRFTTGNWNQPATVTVTVAKDANGVGEHAVIGHAASGGGYDGVSAVLAVNVVDNDTVGLAFSPERISLAAGASATYTLRLTAPPTEAVSVSLSSADAALSASPALLQFAADEWPAERGVTVSAAADAPTHTAALNHRAAGGEYEGLEAALEVQITADLRPAFAADAVIADQNYIQGIEAAPLVLPAASGGDGELRYALSPALPAGLTFDPATRTLAGAPTEAAPAAVYTYTATDSDASGPDSASLGFSLAVAADLMPDFAGATVADLKLTQNLAMAPLTLPAASGGDGELRYALSPALPAGLTFDPATRTLAGAPTEAAPAAVYTYTATDSDASGPDSASLGFSLAVAADLMPDFAGATVADLKLTQNLAMAPLTLPAASSGDGELRYSLSPALPAGLTFDPATRTLSGTPVEAASAAVYTYMATDSDAADPDSASLSFSIEVSISEVEKKMLEDALSAQGRALLTSATGVIGGRFRAPAAARAEVADGEGERDRAETMLNAFAGWLAGAGGGRGGYGAHPAAGGTPGFGPVGGQFSAPRGAFGTGAAASGGNFGSVGAPLPVAGFGFGAGRAPAATGGYGPGAMSGAGANFGAGPASGSDFGAGALGFDNAFADRTFALPLNAATGAEAVANPSPARWTLWGAADSQHFDGASESGAYDGGVDSLWLGADTRLGNGVLIGAAVSRSRGETDYDIGGRRGGLETSLTSVLPYIRGETASGLELWALGGVGGGGAENFSGPAGAPVETADLDMNMAAAGLRQPLAQRGAVQFSLVASGGYVSLRTDGNGARRAVDGLDVNISQARLSLEVSRPDGALRPYLRLGARGDGGDGQAGGGLEMTGGLHYAGARFDFEAQARWLAAHSVENYEEFGGMARLTVKSRADGSGPRLTFAPTWGGVSETLLGGGSGTRGGMMFGGPDIAALAGRGAAAGAGAMTLESDLGWGFAFDRGLLTLGATHSRMGPGGRETVGFSWDSATGESGAGLGRGLKLRFGYELPTPILEGGPRLELNYTARF